MPIEPWYAKRDITKPDPSWPWCMQPNQFMLDHVGGGMVTDRFILIGMPHTGSGALHEWLPKIKGLHVVNTEGHKPYSYSVAKCKEARIEIPPAFTFVRNPWEWNVAIWCWIRHVNRRWFCGSFADLLELQRYTRHWSLPDINTAGITAAWGYLECERATYVGKLEDYDNQIPFILGRLIPDLITESQVRGHVRRTGRSSGSAPMPDGTPKKPYQQFYTPAQRDMVAELEAGLIERFGYSFSDKGREF